jgi:hypothetical protein
LYVLRTSTFGHLGATAWCAATRGDPALRRSTMSVRWSIPDIADAIESALRHAASAIDAEQAVYGIDALDEVALHPILASGLEAAGFGAHAEVRYPVAERRRLSEIERCDLVLTPANRPLARPEATGTLFDPPDAVALDEAFWMEVKSVSQFLPGGPNRSYASQLLSTVRHDVIKLSRAPGILHAGLLIVLFVESEPIADHDLGIWQERCLKRLLPIGVPCRRQLRITNRIGNGNCAVALYPVSHAWR